MSGIKGLLAETSRTFALSIPLLPRPLRYEVSVAYLLFRIADTIEDEPGWSPESRRAALRRMIAAADDELHPASGWLTPPESPLEHKGYARLLAQADDVTAAYMSCRPEAREIIRTHLARCASGMLGFLDSPPDSLDRLREYCYFVAGIVGEMCTHLFMQQAAARRPPNGELIGLARSFGEGLQLVNIIRDDLADRRASRRFIPHETDVAELRSLAAEDLEHARTYLGLLLESGVPAGVIAFNKLNLSLARATLARLEERGAGVKLTRGEVVEVYEAVTASLGSDSPDA